MKKKRLLAFILIFALLLSLPVFATTNRASDQIGSRNVRATALSGQIYVKASIVGMGVMNKIGTESIYIFEKSNSLWVLNDFCTEDDAGMSATNAAGHMGAYYFDSEVGVEYKVVVTVFAENDAGRDSRTDIFYVTGK